MDSSWKPERIESITGWVKKSAVSFDKDWHGGCMVVLPPILTDLPRGRKDDYEIILVTIERGTA